MRGEENVFSTCFKFTEFSYFLGICDPLNINIAHMFINSSFSNKQINTHKNQFEWKKQENSREGI